jgi:hypothetical protein
MMDDVDAIFSSLVADIETTDGDQPRYITRTSEGFVVTLTQPAREAVSELAILARFAAKAADAPALYDDPTDQSSYELLAAGAVTSAALHDCDIVQATIFADIVSDIELHAWLRVLNHIKSLITSQVSSQQDMAALRASRSDAAHLLDFVGAVQHEVLEALM